MLRRSKYDLNAIWEAVKIECPHCHFILEPSQYLTLDQRRLRCKFCDGTFERGTIRAADADELESARSERGLACWPLDVYHERVPATFGQRMLAFFKALGKVFSAENG